jgi:glutaredoxin
LITGTRVGILSLTFTVEVVMSKVLVLAALAFASSTVLAGSLAGPKTAAPAKGKPIVRLFVGPDCGTSCANVQKILSLRKVAYEEVDVTTLKGGPGKNEYGVTGYPTIFVGDAKFQGDDIMLVSSMLAEAFGKDVLSKAERAAMDGHFNAKGHPKVVLYGTKWCGYCKTQREVLRANKIEFDDIDVESNPAGMSAYRALRGSGYPLTFVGYRRFNGVKHNELLAAYVELTGRPQPNIR